MRSYENKVKRCKLEGRSLYRTSQQSSHNRKRKKLLGKLEWYKKRRVGEASEVRSQAVPRREAREQELPTRTVLFVEFTPQSELAKRLREALAGIEKILGFKIRVVEKTGTPLRLLFSPTTLWQGEHCGRDSKAEAYKHILLFP